ncbi:MAG: NADH-quinone oxidoreductase subunit M [Limisphaerales bacterium]|jgi:NADH-quinone oxidoreductase subunit M
MTWTIYISFIGMLAVLLVPERHAGLARWIALGVTACGLWCGFFGAIDFGGGPVVKTLVDVEWITIQKLEGHSVLPELSIRYALAVDGISATLVILTGLVAVAGVLFSWNIEYRVREYFAFYLALIGGVYGVFLSADLFLLFVFYEIAIVPKYFLIAIWGSTRKEYGAMKLALFSFIGSAMVLIGLIAAYAVSGGHSMMLADLARHDFSAGFQVWAFPLVFVGFAILAGMWPFHTWAPTGHVAAPTAVSMLLAGVVMKLGAYGALRVAMVLFPEGLVYWQETIALLAVIGIVYGAMVAWTQKDFKFVIGYSSVSHMGFVMLGLASLNAVGMSGAVLQMFSHGVIAALLFAVVGRMVYGRTNTRDLGELSKMRLGREMPFAAVVFTIAGLASMGMPGFSGFVAELQVILGAWQAFPLYAVICGVGIVIGVAYTLKAIQTVFFTESELGNEIPLELPQITAPEKVGAMLLIGATLWVGLFPGYMLEHWINPAFQTELFEGLRRGAGW